MEGMFTYSKKFDESLPIFFWGGERKKKSLMNPSIWMNLFRVEEKMPSVEGMIQLRNHYFPTTNVINNWGKGHQWMALDKSLLSKRWSQNIYP